MSGNLGAKTMKIHLLIRILSTKQKRPTYFFAFFIASFLNSSCASILNGATDTVTIVSEVKDSAIYINGEYHGRDDAIVELRKGKHYQIYSIKEGCETTTLNTGDRFDKDVLWGILFGAIVPITIDVLAGNAWEIYPKLYNVTPRC